MANGDESGTPGVEVNFDKVGESIAGALSQVADFTFLKVVPTNFIAEAIALLLALPFKLLSSLVVLAAKSYLDLLETAGPETGALASVALSEIFGTDVSVRAGRSGFGGAEANALGATVLGRLMPVLAGGSQVTGPSAAPAEAFMGELLGVSVRAWLLELLSDLMPEAVRIIPFNDLIEGVLGSMGISRLARVALRPAIQSGVAQPLEWLVLDALRPTLLSERQAIVAWLRGKWTRQQLDDELGAKGFNADRQEAVINETQGRLSIGDIRVLVKNQVWTDEQALTDLAEQGFPNGNAVAMLSVSHLEEIDAVRPRVVAALEKHWKRGTLDNGGFLQGLADLHYRPEVAAVYLEVLNAERAAGLHPLDKAELDRALLANVISLPEWRGGLALLGYADDDITILELTAQQNFASKDAAAKARAEAKALKAADELAKKQAAAAAKIARAAALAAAKEKAAADKIVAQAEKETTLLAKQKLLADQAQARRDQAAAAKAAGVLSAQQHADELARIAAAEQAAAFAVAGHAAIQSALDQAAAQSDQKALQSKTTAEASARASVDATALADSQAALLTERRAERIATFQAQKDKIDGELETGLITQGTHDKQMATLDVEEQAAVRAERLDALAIARARQSAQKTTAVAAAQAAKAAAGVSLVPTATARRTATIAASSSARATLKTQTATAASAARAQIAADKARATTAATSALDTLNAQLLAEFQQFEVEHGPKP